MRVETEICGGSSLTGISIVGGTWTITFLKMYDEELGDTKQMLGKLLLVSIALLITGLGMLLHGLWRTTASETTNRYKKRYFWATFPGACPLISAGAIGSILNGMLLLAESSNPYWPLQQTFILFDISLILLAVGIGAMIVGYLIDES